jgi:uroporphyrin-III C-methyltransferase
MIYEKSHNGVITFTETDFNSNNVTAITCGMVHLVGAGPGDPELLTIKALNIIQRSDVIIYDNLVSQEIRALLPSSAESIYVGKAKGCHSSTQDDINLLIIEKAKLGLTVCRLKGGDSFVFGRGAEEVLALKTHNIDVTITPGITAAAGCSSYAGIPLTHRGLSQGCTFVTAHAEKELDVNWQALANLKHTLVFYMGLSQSKMIETQLIKAGLASCTPVALIENGSCPQQRVITGTLTQLSHLVTSHQVNSPALIMVGEVVSLAEQLQWFNTHLHTENKAEPISNKIERFMQLTA